MNRNKSFGQAPEGYIPGAGRGAAGFTTRSDIGPIMGSSTSSSTTGVNEGAINNNENTPHLSGVGSRASELREAKLRMKQMQQQQQQQQQQKPSPFGHAPKGYIAGAGRGAPMKGFEAGNNDGLGGVSGGESSSQYDEEQQPQQLKYEDDDEEADLIYDAVDARISSRHKKRTYSSTSSSSSTKNTTIGEQFRELKDKLSSVTEEEWEAIPDVGDYSLRHKQKRRQDVFTPLSDSIINSKSALNNDATASSSRQSLSASAVAAEPLISNISGLAEARGTLISMSLDKMQDGKSTSIDPKGYLTSLSTIKLQTNAEVNDIHKARMLLKSIRQTNPKHAPAWIASARVEEAANKMNAARKLIQDGCEACKTSEDVWLEASRLHPAPSNKVILASALKYIPTSVKIFQAAAELEISIDKKKAIYRKALEAIPDSITLWKGAIDVENEVKDALILLQLAVEKVPHCVDFWLALSKLETYYNAKQVLNQARQALPLEKAIWITAAKLEESQHSQKESIDKIISNAVQALQKNEAVITRDQWIKEAESADSQDFTLTSASIIKYTIGLGVDPEDRLRTWSSDASSALNHGAVGTARAILAHALAAFPTKKSLWIQAVELEQKHGSSQTLQDVLKAASERLPRVELFWLIRAKEMWYTIGDVDGARNVLREAFAANPDSEAVWLAGVKLEWETNEFDRARVLLQRARERAPTYRVYMKSALFEREQKNFKEAIMLINEGLKKYPTTALKLYIMGGQISITDLNDLNKARGFYQKGLENCPTNVVLWKLVADLEESYGGGVSKARSLYELARLKNPMNDYLWLHSIRLERRASSPKLAASLLAKALKECPYSGILLAEAISTAPKVEQKSKSTDAIKKCPDDPYVIVAVASLFASERKITKARKWFERGIILNPDIGTHWARYYLFESEHGTKEQKENVKKRCVESEPKHGEIWCEVSKDMNNRRKNIGDILESVTEKLRSIAV